MPDKRTPGPWRADREGHGFILESHGVMVAGVYPLNRTANAALIAAAPDLLAALEHVNSVGDTAYHLELVGSQIDFDLVTAAIAKARGGQ